MHAAVVKICRQLTPPEWPTPRQEGGVKTTRCPPQRLLPMFRASRVRHHRAEAIRRNSNKHAQGGGQNLAPANAPGVTNATPGGRGKNHKVPAPTVAPNVPGEQGAPPQSGGQKSAPRNLSKHAQGGHHSTGQSIISRPHHRPACRRKSTRSTLPAPKARLPLNRTTLRVRRMGRNTSRNTPRSLHLRERSKASRRSHHLRQRITTSIRSAPRLLPAKLRRSHLMRPRQR